jgi:hypothetical protein
VPNANDQSELILYQSDDGITRIHVRLVDGSVWLTQRQLAGSLWIAAVAKAARQEEERGVTFSPGSAGELPRGWPRDTSGGRVRVA